MLDFLLTPLLFILAISVLIAVHEFGHFWVAQRMGVKVLRYSIGFGKPLWSRRGGRDQTEYVIAAIPLGGYVKMLDEREGAVAPEEAHRAFNRQPLRKRFAVVAAGPAFNLAFAIVLYWAMFIYGVPGIRPILAEPAASTLAAEVGLRGEQEITAIAGTTTPTWAAVFDTLLPYALRKETVAISVDDGGVNTRYELPLERLQAELDAGALIKEIGLSPFRPHIAPVIDVVKPGSAAEQGGLRSGDEVTAVNGSAITDWEALVLHIRESADKELRLTVLRNGNSVDLSVRPASVAQADGTAVGQIGASVRVDQHLAEQMRREWRLEPLHALSAAVEKTWDMSTLTLRMLGEMIVGRASVENISGPITIAIYAKSSALAGFAQFLGFLAIVSVSLGVLNLLPVPILDGGHLLFYVVEAITGKPLSETAEAIATKIGLAIILFLMTIALYNDMARLLGGE